MSLSIKYWLSKLLPVKNFLILNIGKDGKDYFYNISSGVFSKNVRFVSVYKVRETSKTIVCCYTSICEQNNAEVISYLHFDKKQFYNQLKKFKVENDGKQ